MHLVNFDLWCLCIHACDGYETELRVVSVVPACQNAWFVHLQATIECGTCTN